MDNFTRTPEDRAKSGFWAAAGVDPPSDPPLVEYRPDGKTYAFGCVVLAYCPWCGAKLPEINSRMPPLTMGHDERRLEASEVSALASPYDERQALLAHVEGLRLDSELVSFSSEFGFIFRYEVVTDVDDPVAGKFRFTKTYVISSLDGKRWSFVDYPPM
jgi:hypothetical protein